MDRSGGEGVLNDWRQVPATAVVQAMVGQAMYWQRDLSDGHLMLIVAYETGGWHMSISHRRDSLSGPVPGRNPTWKEIRDARYKFLPDGITMAMLLPPRSEYVNVHSTTFHLYEVPRTKQERQ